MMDVRLSPTEMMTAAHIGLMRQVQNLKKGRKDAQHNRQHDRAYTDHDQGTNAFYHLSDCGENGNNPGL